MKCKICNKNKERGASLLLTILVLTAIMSIALGISTLMLVEMKLSREVIKSLRAYYAAEAGIERSLYDDRKEGGASDIGSSPSWCAGIGKVCLDGSDTCYAVDVTVGATTYIKSYGCYKGARRAIEVSY